MHGRFPSPEYRGDYGPHAFVPYPPPPPSSVSGVSNDYPSLPPTAMSIVAGPPSYRKAAPPAKSGVFFVVFGGLFVAALGIACLKYVAPNLEPVTGAGKTNALQIQIPVEPPPPPVVGAGIVGVSGKIQSGASVSAAPTMIAPPTPKQKPKPKSSSSSDKSDKAEKADKADKAEKAAGLPSDRGSVSSSPNDR